MSCSNCYNGCPQITSDQCVKYTGVDVPILGIKNGDSLSYVEQAIITFLTSTLDGTGVKPKVEQSIICNIVKKYLPTCGDLSVVDFIKALVQAVCELKTLVDGTIADIDDINDFIASLEAAYDLYTCPTNICPTGTCITGVDPDSGTHAILQAVIDRLCAFIIDVDATYVKLDDLDDLIADYLANNNSGPGGVYQFNVRMVPYSIVAYNGPLSNFDSSGAGLATNGYDKIYLCNGENNTPDLRGRVIVGAISGVPGGSLPAAVNPNVVGSGNPNYALNDTLGANKITLDINEIPKHDHDVTVAISPATHNHNITITPSLRVYSSAATGSTPTLNNNEPGVIYPLSATSSDVTLSTVVTETEKGNNQSHFNIQPVRALYFITYIP
jgi:microcystin-dependent protein